MELIKIFKDADILLTDMANFTAEVMDGLENLKVLLRHGIGYDKVDVAAATRNGIIFANEIIASSEDVAEHAIMLIFETFRKRKQQDKVFNEWINTRKWNSEAVYPLYRMKGKTLGIIGCGNIGSRLLKKIRCLEMNIFVCDPYLTKEKYDELNITHTPFDDVLKQADIISIHVPATKETRGMFHLEKFKLMKKSTVIINTARGSIINTNDLISALNEGIIAGAGLDVYEEEPPVPEHALLQMDNVILSPHIAWYSEESSWDIRCMIMDDVKAFLEGKPPKFVVNPEVLNSPGLRFKI